MSKIKSIKGEEYYTLQDIVKKKLFEFPAMPWINASTFWSVRKIVQADLKGRNILDAKIVGSGRGTKYHFKGDNIINFINQVETGKVRL